MGYVRTVVKRHVAASIDIAVHERRSRVEFEESLFTISDWREDPEREILSRQRIEIAQKVLKGFRRGIGKFSIVFTCWSKATSRFAPTWD